MATPLKPEFFQSLRDAAELMSTIEHDASPCERAIWSGMTTPEIIISLLDEIESLNNQVVTALKLAESAKEAA